MTGSPGATPPTVHATAVAIGDAGILIRGPSGSGKSSLALALIETGEPRATLVADDRVILSVKEGAPYASAPETIAGLLEVRGLGIVRRPYVSPVAIRLCVDLVPLADAPRMPTREEASTTIDGIALPRLFVAIGSPDAPLRVRVALRELAESSYGVVSTGPATSAGHGGDTPDPVNSLEPALEQPLDQLLRRSIKEPIPAIFEAWELLSSAVDAHLAGDRAGASGLFRRANLSEVWHWTNPAWGPSPRDLRLNVKVWRPEGDSRLIPKEQRDPQRDPTPLVKAAVLARDGYRCRYCGIPVVDAGIRRLAAAAYPESIPWDTSDVRAQHAAFQCFWLQYDHVVPHSHGGSSSADNVVVTCALCNYGKDQYTLKQLALSDPRLRAPEPVTWDGLERFRARHPR